MWDPGERGRAFSAWAWAAGVPALEIVLGPRIVLVGPLTIPGRVGCGTCARLRLAAVSPAGAALRRRGHRDRPCRRPGTGRARRRRRAGGPQGHRRTPAVPVPPRRPDPRRRHRHRRQLAPPASSPISRCAVCGGAVDALPRAWSRRLSADDAPEAVLHALAGWVDPLTGVIPSLVMEPDDASDVPVVITASSPHLVEPDGSRRQLPPGRGTGLDVSSAILAAVGDAIGRYCPSTPDPARIAWERLEDLHGEVLDPRAFPLYTGPAVPAGPVPVRPVRRVGRLPVDDRHVARLRPSGLGAGGVLAAVDGPPAAPPALPGSPPTALPPPPIPRTPPSPPPSTWSGRDAFMAAWTTGCAGRRVEIDDAVDPALRRVIAATEALGSRRRALPAPDRHLRHHRRGARPGRRRDLARRGRGAGHRPRSPPGGAAGDPRR